MRVYRYGLLRPTDEQELGLVREQMRLANKYRNWLVWLERGYRMALSELVDAHPSVAPFLSETEASEVKVDAKEVKIRRKRKATRSRSESTEDRQEVATERVSLTERRNALSAARWAALKGPLKAEAKRMNDLWEEMQKETRRQSVCGVFWGTSQIQDLAMKESRKALLWYRGKLALPDFVRWSDNQSVGVQVQDNIPPEDLFRQGSLVRIAPVSPQAWSEAVPRGDRKRLQRTVLSLRVQSDAKRQPVWAHWPMIMHRAIPAGCVVTRVAVRCRMIGPREEWYATITVDDSKAETAQPCGNGTVAMDLGWRAMKGGGIRVARWRDSDGGSGEFQLDEHIVSSLRKAEGLHATRDDNFNEARAKLQKWLAGAPDVPGWLRLDTETLGSWRSLERLQALAGKWKKNRFAGDEEGYAALEQWHYHDYHLWQWESDQRAKSLRHRRELYRIFAAKMACRYSTLVLEDFEIPGVAKKPTVEEDSEYNKNAAHNRQLASPHEFRECMKAAFVARDGMVQLLPCADTTRHCSVCGSLELFDQAKHLWHTCLACEGEGRATTWDQDDNAAQNLLDLWQNGADPVKTVSKALALANKREPAWIKAKRLARAKREADASGAVVQQPTEALEAE